MMTKIFHPNVSTAGEICVNTLKKDWQSTFGIAHILVTVKCLLIYPNPESALDEEAGKLLLENYDDYCSRARLITSVHAKTRPAEFGDAEPVASGSKTKASATAKASAPVSSIAADTAALPSILALAGGAATPPVPTQRVVSASHSSENGDMTPATSKDKVKAERHQSPAPLGTADGNVASAPARDASAAPAPAAAKAIKRGATGTAGVEKKKKALKRL
jgi:ubiquitin-conjugating enzyme E2 S